MPLIYADAAELKDHVAVDRQPEACWYCSGGLRTLDRRGLNPPSAMMPGEWDVRTSILLVCDICGWWFISRHIYGERYEEAEPFDFEPFANSWAVRGLLRELDLSDIQLPLDEVRRYLLAKYDSRFNIDPIQLEHVVGSIFRDLGYEVLVTSRSGDGGIDVLVLESANARPIGVQVKRYRGTIEANQIREFTGALHNQGLPAGIFVATSSYRPGAKREAAFAALRGIPIELWDAKQLYDRLRIAQRPVYQHAEEPDAPFARFWRHPW